MKKTILAFTALSISASIQFSTVSAQTVNNNLGTADVKYIEISLSLGEATSIKSNSENLNTINTRAVRDFTRNYKLVSDEKWFKVSNGYYARFESAGIQNMAAYDLRGNWKYDISYYDEKRLPLDVRAIVKSHYIDYAITCVDEIHIDSKTIYQVHMQDANTWKNVRVYDNKLEEVENYNKK